MTAKNTRFFILIKLVLLTSFGMTVAVRALEDSALQQCVETDAIKSHSIETDQRILFMMTDDTVQVMTLKPHCPQLHFHNYFSYTPVNGRLCANEDEIKTRAGLPCRIDSIKPLETPPIKPVEER